MAGSRYNHVPKAIWDSTAYPLFKGIDADLSALEAGGGSQSLASLPAGAVIYSATTTRPSTRTDLMCIFVGPDPGANAIGNDMWMGS